MNKQAGADAFANWKGVPMKQLLFIPLVSLLILILPGCWDREDLEDVGFMLVLGLDLDPDNNLIVYSMVPIRHKEAKEKEIAVQEKAISLRESRGKLMICLKALPAEESWKPFFWANGC